MWRPMTGSLAVRRRLTQASEASIDQSSFFKRTLEVDPVVGGLGVLGVTKQINSGTTIEKLEAHGTRKTVVLTTSTSSRKRGTSVPARSPSYLNRS